MMTKTITTMIESDISRLREQIFANLAKIFPKVLRPPQSVHGSVPKPEEVFKITTKATSHEHTQSGTIIDCVQAVVTDRGNPLIEGPEGASTQEALVGLLKVTECTLAKYPKLMTVMAEEMKEGIGGGVVNSEALKQGLVDPGPGKYSTANLRKRMGSGL